MKTVLVLAQGEIREGLRNRWVAASIVALATLAFALSALGTAPTGTVDASALSVSVASLSSLSVYLLPLIALMLSFPALVGELERGTLLLLLTYPVARWQVVVGKFVGHVAILMVAVLLGYGAPGLVTALQGDSGWIGWQSYLAMMGSSVLLGAAGVRFPTAGLFHVRFDADAWQQVDYGKGELVWFVTPKLLERLELNQT